MHTGVDYRHARARGRVRFPPKLTALIAGMFYHWAQLVNGIRIYKQNTLLLVSGADVNIQNTLDVARDDGRLDVERLLV